MDSLESSLKECIQARARITAVMDEVAQIARDGRVGADGELPESYEQHLSSVFDGVPEGSEFARDDQYKSLLKVTQHDEAAYVPTRDARARALSTCALDGPALSRGRERAAAGRRRYGR